MIAVVVSLGALALVDGAFSGFRATLGRTGRVDHVAEDRRGLRTGAGLVAALLLPAMASAVVGARAGDGSCPAYRRAGEVFLVVIGPYALLVTLALGVYGALHWRLKYVASALVLGPFTLARPYVVAGAAIAAGVYAGVASIWLTVTLASVAVLAVEPVLNRAWVNRQHGGGNQS